MHKSRFIHKPQLDRSHRVIPIPKGGHDGVTAPEGADNINLLTNSMINQSLGVAGSDANNLISIAQMPSGLNGNASANIEGLTSLEINQQTTYFITDYETFLAYTITAIRGVVSRVGDTITYTAPSSVGPGGFIINGRAVNIPITASFSVNTPVITSPVNNATGLSTSPSFTSNAFGLSGSSDTHEGSDWQIATDASFTNIVSQVTNSASNKLSYNASGLNANTTYHVRVRYKGTVYGYSNWATAVTFTTQTVGTVNQPTITSPANGATGVAASPSFTSTAFVVSSGSDTHEGSDWQIATDAGFTTIVAQTTNSAVNKTTYSIAGLSGGVTYYARVRYKGLAFGYSAWSPTVSFTVISVPTYSVVPTTTTLNEGGNVNFNITTSNVANGTVLYWTINGNNVTSGDFTSGDISGSVIINNNTASVSKTLSNDVTIEGVETFVFNLRTVSISGTIVANSGTITVNDTSVNPNTAPAVTAASPKTYTHPTAQSIAPLGTVSDTELALVNNWNGASLSFVSAPPRNRKTTDRFLDSGLLTFQVENIIGVPTNTAQYNGTRIGTMANGEDGLTGLLKITFNSNATTAIVQNVLRAVQYQSSIDWYYPYIDINITLSDGNTGAQGSGGTLTDTVTVQMNLANGTYLSQQCSGPNLVYTYANGNGGQYTEVETVLSETCGVTVIATDTVTDGLVCFTYDNLDIPATQTYDREARFPGFMINATNGFNIKTIPVTTIVRHYDSPGVNNDYYGLAFTWPGIATDIQNFLGISAPAVGNIIDLNFSGVFYRSPNGINGESEAFGTSYSKYCWVKNENNILTLALAYDQASTGWSKDNFPNLTEPPADTDWISASYPSVRIDGTQNSSAESITYNVNNISNYKITSNIGRSEQFNGEVLYLNELSFDISNCVPNSDLQVSLFYGALSDPKYPLTDERSPLLYQSWNNQINSEYNYNGTVNSSGNKTLTFRFFTNGYNTKLDATNYYLVISAKGVGMTKHVAQFHTLTKQILVAEYNYTNAYVVDEDVGTVNLVGTTNYVPDGTQLYWRILLNQSGGVNINDFGPGMPGILTDSGGSYSGVVTVNNNTYSLSIPINNDLITEAEESFIVTANPNYHGSYVSFTTVIINPND
jgi:hypothetical protein